MKDDFVKRLAALKNDEWRPLLREIQRGFEKECLRVDKAGNIAQTPHPKALGSSLMHPLITTDYSESLLEFITPPLSDLDAPFQILNDIHQYTQHVLEDEFLWAGSMPCLLPDENNIPIAVYGDSNLGKLKHIYRRGLGYRYGRAMQTIAGIHYNFSFSQGFWKSYHQLLNSELSLKDFISEQYLGLLRNCLRYSWVLPYLFGASPALSSSFLKAQNQANRFNGKNIEKNHLNTSSIILESLDEDTLCEANATSLRLSDLGYHNKLQAKYPISYNALSEFLSSMHRAVHTTVPEYTRIGIKKENEYRQLSDCVLQIEDEHYAIVRPKRVAQLEERMVAAIARDGIEYIELRALDLNPFIPIGITPETVSFIDSFLLMCLLKESPAFTEAETTRIADNHAQIVNFGRDEKIELKDYENNPRLLQDWIKEILEVELPPFAEILDRAYGRTLFEDSLKSLQQKIANPKRLPSAEVLQDINTHFQGSYIEFAKALSSKHQAHFREQKMSSDLREQYVKMAEESFEKQSSLEKAEASTPFEDFLRDFLMA